MLLERKCYITEGLDILEEYIRKNFSKKVTFELTSDG